MMAHNMVNTPEIGRPVGGERQGRPRPEDATPKPSNALHGSCLRQRFCFFTGDCVIVRSYQIAYKWSKSYLTFKAQHTLDKLRR
jgi:hypothetical protein